MSRRLSASVLSLVLLAACAPVRPSPLAENCAGWAQLNAGDQLISAEALVQPSLMTQVRERQHLQPDTPDEQVYLAVVSSISKTCDGRPERQLDQIITDLYESS